MPRRRKYVFGVPHLTRRRGKSGIWWARVGEKEVSLGTPDRDEALRRLEFAASQRGRLESSPPTTPAAKLTELALAFAEHCRPPRYTAQTARSYTERLTRFIEWAEARDVTRLDQVDGKTVARFVKDRGGGGTSGATINRDLAALRSFMNFLELERVVAASPVTASDFQKLRLREPRPRPKGATLSPAQVDQFLERSKTMSPSAYVALFALTAGSGIRVDEARHIDADDLDEAKGRLTITPKKNWTSKGYRYRVIPVSAATLAAARAFIGLRESVPLDDKSVWDEVQRVRTAAELAKFSLHDLRRAWASAVHANGASLKQVSAWLGHSAVAVTEIYIRLLDGAEDGHRFLPR